MRLFILLLLSAFVAGEITPGDCPGDRAALPGCAAQLLDANNDTQVTEAEITAFLDSPTGLLCVNNGTEFRAIFNAAFIMAQCDADGNGYLDAADWAHANSCLPLANWIGRDYVCRTCRMCGWDGSP